MSGYIGQQQNNIQINIGGPSEVGAPTGACSPQGAQAQQCMQQMDPLSILSKVLGEVANVVRAAKSG
jgi:hypothetical protein